MKKLSVIISIILLSFTLSYSEIITNDLINSNLDWIDAREYASVNIAVEACSSKTLVITNSQRLTANLTLPEDCGLIILKGGSISKASTYTLTIKGSFDAGLYTVFKGFDSGDVTFSSGKVREVYPQWWGALGDGNTNDTTAVQSAADSNAQDLVITEGTFLCNISIDGKTNVRGFGPMSILKAKTIAPVITVSERIRGQKGFVPGRSFRNFTIDGNNKASKGILYDNSGSVVREIEADFESMTFVDCSRGIDFGAAGPIGNNVRYCSFRNVDYGIYMKDSATSQVNLNTFESNRFQVIKLCAIYIDGSTVGAGGNNLLYNWFEGIKGFGIILKGTAAAMSTHDNKIHEGWFESIALSSTVDLDDEGVTTTQSVWATDVPLKTYGTFPAQSLIHDSLVTIDNYRGLGNFAAEHQVSFTGTTKAVIESAIFDSSGGASLVGSNTGSLVVKRPVTLGQNNRGFVVESLPMSRNIRGYTNLTGIQDLSKSGGGAPLAYQDDELFGSGVLRIDVAENTEQARTSSISFTDGKAYAFSFSLKSSTSTSEDTVTLIITGGFQVLGSQTLTARGDRWTHYVGVVVSGNTNTASFRFSTSGTTTVYDISRLQLVEFSTKEEAEAFIHNQQFAVSSTKYNTLADDATPSVISDEIKSVWLTGGTSRIIDFDNGFIGQEILIIAEHSINIIDGTNIFLNGSSNFNMVATDTLTLIKKADGKWYEIARSDNT